MADSPSVVYNLQYSDSRAVTAVSVDPTQASVHASTPAAHAPSMRHAPVKGWRMYRAGMRRGKEGGMAVVAPD